MHIRHCRINLTQHIEMHRCWYNLADKSCVPCDKYCSSTDMMAVIMVYHVQNLARSDNGDIRVVFNWHMTCFCKLLSKWHPLCGALVLIHIRITVCGHFLISFRTLFFSDIHRIMWNDMQIYSSFQNLSLKQFNLHDVLFCHEQMPVVPR